MKMREMLIVLLLMACGPRSAPTSAPGPADPSPSEVATPTEPASPDEAAPPDDAVPPSAPPTGNQADGGPCFAADDCASGVCEGQGCGADTPGICAAKQRACTRDLRTYCGCDGKTFQASGSCPGQRYAAKGSCAGSKP